MHSRPPSDHLLDPASGLSAAEAKERVSALMDAEDGHRGAAVDQMAWASSQWHVDDVREAWGMYHLIGDVMRSDELARGVAESSASDAAFLAGLRDRMAHEPVVLAPTTRSVTATNPLWTHRWNAVAAVAGVGAVAAVAGVLWMSQPPPAQMEALGEPATQVVDSRLIRDAKLDQYLRAHRGGPVALPGGPTGRFETVVLERK